MGDAVLLDMWAVLRRFSAKNSPLFEIALEGGSTLEVWGPIKDQSKYLTFDPNKFNTWQKIKMVDWMVKKKVDVTTLAKECPKDVPEEKVDGQAARATSLALKQETIQALVAETTFRRIEIETVKNAFNPDLNDDEFITLMLVAQKTGLSPLARQIYGIKRYNKKAGKEIMTLQTGIDGFRLIAQRTGEYRGRLGPFWWDDGKRDWVDVWVYDEPPKAAKVGVWREGHKEPVWGIARWSAFAVTYYDRETQKWELTPFWAKMPEHMLAKVAESQALRAAFPQELSGIYTSEEMQQADIEEPPAPYSKGFSDVDTKKEDQSPQPSFSDYMTEPPQILKKKAVVKKPAKKVQEAEIIEEKPAPKPVPKPVEKKETKNTPEVTDDNAWVLEMFPNVPAINAFLEDGGMDTFAKLGAMVKGFNKKWVESLLTLIKTFNDIGIPATLLDKATFIQEKGEQVTVEHLHELLKGVLIDLKSKDGITDMGTHYVMKV